MKFKIVTPDQIHEIEHPDRDSILDALTEAEMEWHYVEDMIVVWEKGTSMLDDEVKLVIAGLSPKERAVESGSSLHRKNGGVVRASGVAGEMNRARVEKVAAAIVESERVAPRTNGNRESSHEMVVRVALEMIAEQRSPVLSGDLWNRVESSGIKRANMSVILSNECGRVGGGRLRRVSIGLYDRADGQTVVAQSPAPRVSVKAIPGVGVPNEEDLYDVVLEMVTGMPNYPLQDVMERLQKDYPTVGKGLLALYIADAKFERMSGVRPKRTQREHSQVEQLYEVDDGIEETDSDTAVIALHMMRGLFVKNTDKAGHPYQDSGRPDEQMKYLAACRMLLSGDFSIQQVAAQTGFELEVVVKLANDMRDIQEQMEGIEPE